MQLSLQLLGSATLEGSVADVFGQKLIAARLELFFGVFPMSLMEAMTHQFKTVHLWHNSPNSIYARFAVAQSPPPTKRVTLDAP